MDLVVLAKAPVPGRVKRRLSPPCSPEEAAAIAEAALADTLEAALGAGADRVLLALDGTPGAWLPAEVTVVDQGGGPLDRRLARAWSHVEGRGLQIAMDTPQASSILLARSMATLDVADAALGLAADGGWWAIGLRRATGDVFAGIPTSRPDTGRRQRARLDALGLRVAPLPVLRDVDTFADALAVAAIAPHGRFAAAVADLLLGTASIPVGAG
jgi:glycosyltransferase A (GT-A) superfamily protein (DUF2064 family)